MFPAPQKQAVRRAADGFSAVVLPASDFGPIVTDILVFVGVLIGISLILGTLTAAVLVWRSRNKRRWLLTPLFVIGWFVVIFGAYQIWLNWLSPEARRYRDWKPARTPTHRESLATDQN